MAAPNVECVEQGPSTTRPNRGLADELASSVPRPAVPAGTCCKSQIRWTLEPTHFILLYRSYWLLAGSPLLVVGWLALIRWLALGCAAGGCLTSSRLMLVLLCRQQPATGCLLLAGCWLLAVGCWLADCWLADCWLTDCFRLLLAGCWLLAVGSGRAAGGWQSLSGQRPALCLLEA